MIASSISITVNGSILADAGDGSNGTGQNLGYPYSQGASGSGGAIRLAAPIISGTGTLSAQGKHTDPSACGAGWGGGGVIRLEAFQQSFSGSIPQLNVNQIYAPKVYYATPYNLFLPTAVPSIQVTSLGGVPVNPTPTGSFTIPDVTVNSSSPLAIQISASNIPLGTTATVVFTSQSGPDLPVVSTGLTGTVASSTATASVTLPTGFSLGYVKANWTQ